MGGDRERELEECVLRILKHGDPNKLTESKVRKLAASETGFDLTDPSNRKVVKRTVRDYFWKQQDDRLHRETAAQSQVALCKPLAKQPADKPGRRRNLIVDDDEDEEAELYTRDTGSNEKPEESEQLDTSVEAEEEDERKPISRVKKKRREDDMEDEAMEQVNGKKNIAQGPVNRRRSSSDEDRSQFEEKDKERADSRQRYNPASARDNERWTVQDEESKEKASQLKKRPESKRFFNGGDPVCQLSKNRFVTVQDFNGKTLISLREYYEKDGELLPTQKGISLTVEQWEAFREGIPDIEAAVKELRR